jgi:glycerol-3-phosphate dehydrogenase (NAD(P)+)
LAHAAQGLIVIATPMAALRHWLGALPDDRRVVWLCKGLESGSGMLGHEVAQQLRPRSACAVLSGPSFAAEVARRQPTALVAASTDETFAAWVAEAFHSDALRVYSSSDVIGVEVGGAVKNVLAIAVGILDGMAARASGADAASLLLVPGMNARAALITRGLAEMTRLGLAMGARPDTFMGLSGLGDLVLTATGSLSRNRQVGIALAAGQPLAEALSRLGHVAEGVSTTPAVAARAAALGVEMPIVQAVEQILQGRLSPAQAMQSLMARDARSEKLQ